MLLLELVAYRVEVLQSCTPPLPNVTCTVYLNKRLRKIILDPILEAV